MSKARRVFASPSCICLIGGGDIMVETARMVSARGIAAFAVVAPRHAGEALQGEAGTLSENLRAIGVPCHETEDIGALDSWPHASMPGSAKLALCFGPAWIFPPHVRDLFEQGMYNLNLIPQPRYLGGAHYTWQIMNGDKSGACVLQEITHELDLGDILLNEPFAITEDARLPIHYFEQNLAAGKSFMSRVIERIIDGEPFEVAPYDDLARSRLYLPRLLTDLHGIVDWRWQAMKIVRFCCAFDTPYPGATSWLNGEAVRLRDVSLAEDVDEAPMHPFAAGLVLRAEPDHVLVAAPGGFITVASVEDADGANLVPKIRDGWRFTADPTALAQALATRAKVSATGPAISEN
ncbi:MAG TPA: hypothetical protein QF891_00700 [Rhodospirillales bacterium]|nr:hypothetical protein [Rhodospirillales bacterium]